MSTSAATFNAKTIATAFQYVVLTQLFMNVNNCVSLLYTTDLLVQLLYNAPACSTRR